jgi:hypothetical protein
MTRAVLPPKLDRATKANVSVIKHAALSSLAINEHCNEILCFISRR